MQLRPGPPRGSDANAVYLSPNDPFAELWQPKGEAVLDVASPSDLVRRSVHERGGGAGAAAGALSDTAVSNAELVRMKQRVSYLEGALAQSEKVEAAAQRFADTLEQRTSDERQRHTSELDALRTQLDHKERELRTLALEMGKVQGRLEAAEGKLLTAGVSHPAGRPEPDRPASTPVSARGPASMAWTQTTMGMFLVGVITVGVVALLLLAMTS